MFGSMKWIAPANNPEIIVYVALDYPKAQQIIGSTLVAPIVGNILEEYSLNGHLSNIEGEPLPKKFQWKIQSCLKCRTMLV